MFSRYRDYKQMTDNELADASFNIEKLVMKGVNSRNHPKYKTKFKNQPNPNINPALMELRDNIANEIKERNNKNEQT